MISRPNKKKHVLWLHGRPNSGKSELCRLIDEVFDCQYAEFNPDHICALPPSTEHPPQMVLCPEIAMVSAFGNRQYTKTLQLFEGVGAFVKPNLYQGYAHMWQDCFFTIASNEIPSHPLVNEVQWKAISSRVIIVRIPGEHDGLAQFPYKAGHLAIALRHLLNERAVLLSLTADVKLRQEEEDDIDIVPDNNDVGANIWQWE